MKTPREILLGRHRASEPKLDAIRRDVVAGMAGVTADSSIPKERAHGFLVSLREFLFSLRWHATAISAVLLLAGLLGREPSRDSKETISGGPAPSPEEFALEFLEYRRHFVETIDQPAKEPPRVPHACVTPRRTEKTIGGMA